MRDGRNAVGHGASCRAADHVRRTAGGDPGRGGAAGRLPRYISRRNPRQGVNGVSGTSSSSGNGYGGNGGDANGGSGTGDDGGTGGDGGNGSEQATIRMDDNLTDRVDATVTDGTLRLGLKLGSNVRNVTLSADVTVSRLDRLATSGASKVTLGSPVTGPPLRLDANGASQVTGPVGVYHLEASESGASALALSGCVGSLHLSSAGTSQPLAPDWPLLTSMRCYLEPPKPPFR